MKKKRIWIINHYATNMFENTSGRHYWFARKLTEQGYQVDVICANTFHNSTKEIELNNRLYAIKTADSIPFVFIKTVSANKNNHKRVFNMIGFYLNLMRSAKNIAKEIGPPDLIIGSSVHPLAMVAGIKLARKFKVPAISEVRDLWPESIFKFSRVKEESLLGKALIRGEHWIYKNSDAIIFTKEGDIDYIKEKNWTKALGGQIDEANCHYINNGIELSNFYKQQEKYQVDDSDLKSNKFKVVYVGAIRPVNDVSKIISAAKRLKHREDILFLIYGSGNEEELIKKKIKEEALTNVKLKGKVDKKYIPYILQQSDLNVLNYSQCRFNWARGNSSNKLFEYMASGKPVLSTVVMGYSMIDKHQCGIEVKEDKSGKNIEEAILEVKGWDPDKYNRIAENSRVAAKEYDFNFLTQKLVKVIEDL